MIFLSMKEETKLPKWLIKTFENGKEREDLCFMLIYCVAFYLLGILFLFVYNPLGDGYFTLKIIISAIALILLIVFGYWLNKKVTLLEQLRKKTLDLYKKSKTENDIKKSYEKIKELCISVPKKVLY